jgi:hypothetical protein
VKIKPMLHVQDESCEGGAIVLTIDDVLMLFQRALTLVNASAIRSFVLPNGAELPISHVLFHTLTDGGDGDYWKEGIILEIGRHNGAGDSGRAYRRAEWAVVEKKKEEEAEK